MAKGFHVLELTGQGEFGYFGSSVGIILRIVKRLRLG